MNEKEIKQKEAKHIMQTYGRTDLVIDSGKGAYVFDITADNIVVRGKITHDEKNNNPGIYRWWGEGVRRSLFVDDVLYTVSNLKVKANSLGDLSDIKEVKLPFEIEQPVYYA